MTAEQAHNIWDKNWHIKASANPAEILFSRFSLEAYHCLKSFIDPKNDKFMLESGCGTGRLCCLLARDFSETQIYGIDLSNNALEIANRAKDKLDLQNAYFHSGDVFNLPFSDNTFDVVFNEGVIEHFSLHSCFSYIDAVSEMIRVTKTGGKIVVAVPNWFNFPHTFYKSFLRLAGKRYRYGYEKSFRHSELKRLFVNLKLKDMSISGFYVAHGFYRLEGPHLYRIFTYFGKLTDFFQDILTVRLKRRFVRRFGIELMIQGFK